MRSEPNLVSLLEETPQSALAGKNNICIEFEAVLVAAFSSLYMKLYYFNNSDDILNLLMKFILTRKSMIRSLITNFLREILEEENPSFRDLKSCLEVKSARKDRLVS